MKLLGAHQNIVSLVGCCTLQERKFLVIEYVPFGDLLQWLRSRRRSVRPLPKEYVNNLMLPQVFCCTVEPRLSGPRLSGFLDYPD